MNRLEQIRARYLRAGTIHGGQYPSEMGRQDVRADRGECGTSTESCIRGHFAKCHPVCVNTASLVTQDKVGNVRLQDLMFFVQTTNNGDIVFILNERAQILNHDLLQTN